MMEWILSSTTSEENKHIGWCTRTQQTRVQYVQMISEDINIQDSSEQMDTVPDSRFFVINFRNMWIHFVP
jgi:hypothetical protein